MAKRKCPICGKPAVAEFQPFCSKRCSTIDLGRWLGERYRAPGEPAPRAANGSGEPEDGE